MDKEAPRLFLPQLTQYPAVPKLGDQVRAWEDFQPAPKLFWLGRPIGPKEIQCAEWCHQAEQIALQRLHEPKQGTGWHLALGSKPLPMSKPLTPWKKGWRLTCAHIIRLTCAHRFINIFNSPAHTSVTFFSKQPMLPQTQLRTPDSPNLRTHKLSHDLFLLIVSCWVGMGGGGVLITSLWTFICISCSLLPQHHVTQMLCV